MGITHTKVSAKSDGSDSSLVQPSDWNAGHTINLFVDEETPTGSINSSNGDDGNGTFTLAQSPSPVSSIRLYKNGILLQRTAQYQLSGSTITYVEGFKPRTGDHHVAFYRIA